MPQTPTTSRNSSATSGRSSRLEELLQVMTLTDIPFETITYSKQHTTTTEQIIFSHPRPRASTPVPLSSTSASDLRIPMTNAPMIHVPSYVPRIPHPSELHAPIPSENPDAYWVITVGQEVGIFFNWLDVAERTHGISGAIQVRQETWADALRLYTRKYNEGAVEARPHVGGHFWAPSISQTGSSIGAPSAPVSPSLSATSSEDSIWTHVEDLSEHMSQVTHY